MSKALLKITIPTLDMVTLIQITNQIKYPNIAMITPYFLLQRMCKGIVINRAGIKNMSAAKCSNQNNNIMYLLSLCMLIVARLKWLFNSYLT